MLKRCKVIRGYKYRLKFVNKDDLCAYCKYYDPAVTWCRRKCLRIITQVRRDLYRAYYPE
jgi:hypothetical protein